MKLSDINFSHEHYRGYDIRVSCYKGMRIERGGIWVVDVPSSKSWLWAREFIDALCNPLNCWWDGTSTGIAMRADDKGRTDSGISMVQGDRRDVLVMAAMRKFACSGGNWYFDYQMSVAIVDAHLDPTGRWTVDPLEYYGLTAFEADLLSNLNDGIEEL